MPDKLLEIFRRETAKEIIWILRRRVKLFWDPGWGGSDNKPKIAEGFIHGNKGYAFIGDL